MMFGLGLLQFFSPFIYVKRTLLIIKKQLQILRDEHEHERLHALGNGAPFDIFSKVAKAEWDTYCFSMVLSYVWVDSASLVI